MSHRQFGAAGHQRHGLQRMIGPAALRGGDQRALEGGVAALLEEVHQRLAEQGRRFLVAEQLDPGRVDVDDDAFLHVGDRVGRPGHEGLHLVAVLAGRGQRAGQRAVEARGVQFAGSHGLQPRARAAA